MKESRRAMKKKSMRNVKRNEENEQCMYISAHKETTTEEEDKHELGLPAGSPLTIEMFNHVIMFSTREGESEKTGECELYANVKLN
jgi:hypothetical protein